MRLRAVKTLATAARAGCSGGGISARPHSDPGRIRSASGPEQVRRTRRQRAQRRHDIGRRLHQLDQHALAAERKLRRCPRVHEAHVVPAAPLRMPPGRKAHALRRQPIDGARQVVDPQARRGSAAWSCTAGFVSGSMGCIRSTSTRAAPLPERADVLVHVLALAAEVPVSSQTEQVDPEPRSARLVGAADGDLLHAQHGNGRAARCGRR